MNLPSSEIRKSFARAILTVGALFLATIPAWAAPVPDEAVLLRGKYLVEQVALCSDCHSPHDEKGQVLPGRFLMGAGLPFVPAGPMPVWASVAPRIAGLPTLNAAQAEEYLTTGGGRPAGPTRPPMPAYRFSPEDAKAVVVYLKNLKSKAH